MQRRIIWGETARQDAIPILPPSGFSAKILGNIMDISWENFELEMKYLTNEELNLLKQLRS